MNYLSECKMFEKHQIIPVVIMIKNGIIIHKFIGLSLDTTDGTTPNAINKKHTPTSYMSVFAFTPKHYQTIGNLSRKTCNFITKMVC